MANYQIYGFIFFVIVFRNSLQAFVLPSKETIYEHQVYRLMDLMVELNKIHNFDNIIIYRTPGHQYEPPVQKDLMLKLLQIERPQHYETVHKSVGNIIAKHVFSRKLYKPVMIFTISPWNYVNSSQAIPNLGNILTNNNLAVVILSDIINIELKEFLSMSLGASLETKIIFLLIGNEMTDVLPFVRLIKMLRFFRWCWSKNILNVVLLFQRDHIEKSLKELKLEAYTYSPFPKPIRILHLTGKQPKEMFKNRITNLQGYQFRTLVLPDKPRVFKYFDPYSKSETITGISAHVYMEYIKYINATFIELPCKDLNISWDLALEYIYKLLQERQIDISIHPLTVLKPHKFFTSYPITNTNSCVVAPVIPEIYAALYIPRTLHIYMWILWFLFFIVFQLAYVFINHHLTGGKMELWLAFSFTLKGLLSMPLDNIKYEYKAVMQTKSIACRRKLFVHMLLLLTGMIYCQSHLAALTSFLSSTLYPSQIESLEDLRKANISIMLADSTYDVYNYLDLIPENFSNHLMITDTETVSSHLNRLDTAYAYTVYKAEWKVMQHLQANLWRPRFKIVPQLCIPNVYLNLPMQFNSPFYHSFMRFILKAQATGLEVKWSNMVFWQIQQANSLNSTMQDVLQHPAPLTLIHFAYVFYIYIGGMVMALIAFMAEIICSKKSQKLKVEEN